MSETKTAKPATAGKFSKPEPAEQNPATRQMVVNVFVCVVLWLGIYAAHMTGDMSTRLALGLAAAVLAVGAFRTGTWCERNIRKAVQ
jgi:hypothetical protein